MCYLLNLIVVTFLVVTMAPPPPQACTTSFSGSLTLTVNTLSFVQSSLTVMASLICDKIVDPQDSCGGENSWTPGKILHLETETQL